MHRLAWPRLGACLLMLCALAATPALAQTPDAIRTALSKVEETGKGPYSDTVFQKNIPLIGKSPMPGSAWRVIWDGLPKPRTRAVVDAAMAGLSAPVATPDPVTVSKPAPVIVPVVVSAPPVVVAQEPPPVVLAPPAQTPPSASDTDAGPLLNVIPNGGSTLVAGAKMGAQSANKPYSITTDGRRIRFEIRKGDQWRPEDGIRGRAELSGMTAPVCGWSRFSSTLTVKAQLFHSPAQWVLSQEHGTADKGVNADATGEHAQQAFRLDTGAVPIYTVAGSQENPLRTIPKSITVWRGTTADFPLDVPHRIVMERMSCGPAPYARFSLDGIVRATYHGDVGYVNVLPPYWKEGIYRAQPALDDDATTVATYQDTTLETAAYPPAP